MTFQPDRNSFDEYSANYDAALAEGLSASGEDKEYFASGRMQWLANCLSTLNERPQFVLDFGCGTGTAVPFMVEKLAANSIIGVDISLKSLEIARQRWGDERAKFFSFGQYHPAAEVDLAFCNGVFHHIPVAERDEWINYVYRSLRPGGIFAFWENNPWNPGTRYVMSRVAFDRDAITLSSSEARNLVTAGGFEILRCDFLFIFPRLLSWLRPVEPYLAGLPLGGQYQVLCRKPCSSR
jgi:SAM-dependent methyltransferase